MLFFQLLLLGGYALAHFATRVAPPRQAGVLVALLLVSVAFLPILPSDAWKPAGSESPVWRILGLLAATVGLPYLLLSSTAPLVQDWFHRDESASPYRLYAWSNAGSLAALLAYPLILEPAFGVGRQAGFWSFLYVTWAAGCGWLVLRRARHPAPATPGIPSPAAPIPTSRYALWVAFSACGSGILLAITNLLSLDLPPFPFLWIAPLALYLVSFIVAFGGGYRRTFARVVFMAAIAGMAVVTTVGNAAPLWARIVAGLVVLFAICLVCHGELAESAPAGAGLTSFYLAIAAGGALGGVIVGLLAPAVFKDFWELPLFLVAPCLLLFFTLRRGAARISLAMRLGLIAALWLAVAAFVRPMFLRANAALASTRNFYGVMQVSDDAPSAEAKRRLRHGAIVHGTQYLDSTRAREPTAYYAEGSGVSIAIRQHPRRRDGLPLVIGVVGLGAGTIATYGTPGDTIRFYEIDPDVATIAERYFTFLRTSPARVDVVVGDGRLALEREMAAPERRHRYDVLVVDGFSSDAIPIHLLTAEAMALYWQALKADGILALHTGTRFVNLAPVVLASARVQNKTVLRIHQSGGGPAVSSVWLLVTDNHAFLDTVTVGPRTTADLPADEPVSWTDEYSNLLRVLTPGS